MPTGEATGVFVLDLDIKEEVDGRASLATLEAKYGQLPATVRVRTPSGGEHHYFSMPPDADIRCSTSKIGPGIDIRGNGGYVILPPSEIRDQHGDVIGRYEWESHGDPVDPPDWLTALITQPSPVSLPPWRPDANAELDELCTHVASAQPGTRNDTLNKAAFAAGRAVRLGRFTESAGQRRLISAARACGLDEAEAQRTTASGLKAALAKSAQKPVFVEENGKGGTDTRSLRNVSAFLNWSGIGLRWNAFTDRYELTGLKGHRYLDDKSVADLWGKAHEANFRVDKRFLGDCMEVVALRHEVHPVRDYFDGLVNKWDGIERLDMWLTCYLSAEDTPYVSAVGAKTLIAAVRRIREPGAKFDQMPILEGPQGSGKSSAIKRLTVREDWFTDCVALTNDSKVMIEQTEGKLIVEVPELKGMRQAEVEHVKATLSRTHDRARRSYGHYTDEVPRQFIIVGTTNTEKGGKCWYLKDPTGNRRFWPVKTGSIDLARLTQDRDQLWAEAVAREAAGEAIELPRELWQAAQGEQQARMERDPWVEELHNVLGDIEGKLLTSDARLIVSRNLERWASYQNDRLGRAMRELGWEHKELRTDKSERGRAYFYVKGQEPWGTVTVSLENNAQVSVYLERERDGKPRFL